MTIDEKRKAVIEYCNSHERCLGCVLFTVKEPPICTKINFNKNEVTFEALLTSDI